MPIELSTRDQVAVITMHRPPVNSLSRELRGQLVEAFSQATLDTTVVAIVIRGEGNFSAGADINEFAGGEHGDAFADPVLPGVVALLENSSKPVVAAISGVCLGGGLEVALGCHVRIADSTARFALPEIKLGMLPGAGGTQRLPRLIGVEPALELILSGAQISAARAAELGLARLTSGDVTDAAISAALSLIESDKPLPRTRERRAVFLTREIPEQYFNRQLEIARKTLPANRRCIESVRAAYELPFDEGGRVEWLCFHELLRTTEARALQHIFFAERAASRIEDLPPQTKPRSIATIAVLGAGTMGAGIAMSALNVGIPVVLIDRSPEAVAKGLCTIERTYDGALKRGRLTADERKQRIKNIRTSIDIRDVRDADLIIEAVFEDLAVKEQAFRSLDSLAKPGAVLASNTSTLDINRIANFTKRPEDVVGMHFFSPAHVMRLLEVVRGNETAPDVLATAMAFARRIGKVGVIARVCDGFIGNRMVEEYLRQAYFLLDEGALPEQIDGALERWGMAMGPLAVMDLAGNDIGWAIRKRRAREQADRPYSAIPDRLCERGRFGQKTGSGFYVYDSETRRRSVDPLVSKLITDYSEEIGVHRREISDEEIVSRCVLALINEGAKLLEEGIAQRASDIDVVYVSGYGFPAHRGGPMFHASSLGEAHVLEQIESFRTGYHPEAWKPASLLLHAVREELTLAQAADKHSTKRKLS